MNPIQSTSAAATGIPVPKRVNDLSGQVFGRWTVLYYVGKAPNCRHALWRVRCSCPKQTEKEIEGYVLVRGANLSCGCYRDERVREANTTHGLRNTPEYDALKNAIQRCHNPKCKAYKNYGARGITVCKEWRESPETFLREMGPRPSPKHSLDRLNNDLGYFKDNCAWRTSKEQQRNRRSNVLIEYNGEKLTAAEWGERVGVSDCAIWTRIRVWGWSIEKAVTTPSKRKKKEQAPYAFPFEWY